jgi:DNA polymerase-3 subunit gamma/tau
LGIEGNVVNVGLPSTETVARESLLRPPTRKFLDGVFTELLGKPMEIAVLLDPSLTPPPASEMALPMGLDPIPSPAPTEAAPTEDFYNDPLIKAAIETFKATLAS